MKKAALIVVLLAVAALWLIGPTSPVSTDSARPAAELASSVSPAPRTTPAKPSEALTDSGANNGATPSAPTPQPATPATFREALARRIAAFRESGPASKDLAAVGDAALAALSANRTVIDSGCFRAGCLVTLKVSEDEAAAVAASMEAPSSAAGRWPGPRQRLEPVPLKDGTAHITWLLHAP